MYSTLLPFNHIDLSELSKEQLAIQYEINIRAILSNHHCEEDYLKLGYQLNKVIEEAHERGISENDLKDASSIFNLSSDFSN